MIDLDGIKTFAKVAAVVIACGLMAAVKPELLLSAISLGIVGVALVWMLSD